VRELADRGVVRALVENEHLRNGLNVCRGAVTQREVAQARGYPYVEPLRALGV
jgi:alanine dehydrogenase